MTVLAERYELGDVLGEGGMGRVVIAHDRVLRRDVAVKLLTGNPDPASRARFLREARGTARLRHPNAVTVFDTGEHDGQPFIVMELVRGSTLAELVEQDGPLDVEVAMAITAGVLEALDAAHRAGLVHRDVKPANVILPHDGGVKLTDFGIARAMDDATAGLTAAGTVLGTPAYLAPELVDGGKASPASDLYSVGCMLYLQLTGQPPFTADSPLAVAYAHRNREIPAVEDRRPDVPMQLRNVIATALAKDPGDRYADAAAMRAALLDAPDPGRDSVGTLPLTGALPGPTGTAGNGVSARGGGAVGAGAAGASSAASDRATDDTVLGAAGTPDRTPHGEADPTVALGAPTSRSEVRSRSPWVAFAIGAAVLLAFVVAVLLLTSGGDDPVDDPETLDEPDGTDDPGTDDPGTDDTGVTDGADGDAPTGEPGSPSPDTSTEPDTPQAPAPEQPGAPSPDDVEPPGDGTDESPPTDDGPPAEDGPGDAPGPPGGDGPPGLDEPPPGQDG